ncbi:hypothetical protein EDB83DRAFT_2314661 [Lactarius deliciosus]|nr:hypothetical protein EDB83DRAFT_2314661 [Lactarius deliciosus]
MCKFLESMGVLAKKNYFPDLPDKGIVKAYKEHGLLGPDPSTPCICLKQMFKGKWNKEVVDLLTTKFILAVKLGTYKPVQHTWPQMTEDKTYYRRRKNHALNHHRNPEAWNSIMLLLNALGTLGTSNDKTDNDLEHLNPDWCSKSVQHVNTGFLNPAIAQIWASVKSYLASLHPSHGNHVFKCISKAKSTSKNHIPLSGLPVNFYGPQWLKAISRLVAYAKSLKILRMPECCKACEMQQNPIARQELQIASLHLLNLHLDDWKPVQLGNT